MPAALKKYYKYPSNVQSAERSSYSYNQWIALVKRELDAGRQYNIVVVAQVVHILSCVMDILATIISTLIGVGEECLTVISNFMHLILVH